MEDQKVDDDTFMNNSFLSEEKEKDVDGNDGKEEDRDGGAESLSESISPSKRAGRRSRRKDNEEEDHQFATTGNNGDGGGAWGQEEAMNRTESENFSLSYERMNRRGRDLDTSEGSDNDESNKNSSSLKGRPRKHQNIWEDEIQSEEKGNEKVAKNNSNNRHRNYHDDYDGGDSGLMIIPDLDDETDATDSFETQVAVAPKASTKKLNSLNELDIANKHIIPSIAGPGLDISLLTSCLVPHDNVQEEDKLWTFDTLLHEINMQERLERSKMIARLKKQNKISDMLKEGGDNFSSSLNLTTSNNNSTNLNTLLGIGSGGATLATAMTTSHTLATGITDTRNLHGLTSHSGLTMNLMTSSGNGQVSSLTGRTRKTKLDSLIAEDDENEGKGDN